MFYTFFFFLHTKERQPTTQQYTYPCPTQTYKLSNKSHSYIYSIRYSSQCIDPSDKCKCPQDKIDQGYCGGAPGCYSEEGITKSICENSGDIWCPDCNKISPAPSPSLLELELDSGSPAKATAQAHFVFILVTMLMMELICCV